MNPLTKALSDISYRIPREILQNVFTPKTYFFRDTPINYEEQILHIVIKSRVMVDCDLVGGTEVYVPLWRAPSTTIAEDRLTTVYNIPKDLTQGRSITSVLSMTYVNSSMSSLMSQANVFDPCTVTDLGIASQAMMGAMSSIPMPSTAKVQLIGENVVMVKDNTLGSGMGLLRCILANDENYSHLQARSVPAFSRLCELAVKSYIYNQYSVTLDKGHIEAGVEISRFKEFVDSYSDAEEQYQEYLRETWQKVAFMNDHESYERFLRLMIGGYR